MEYWHFSKKELDLIADLMLEVLLTKPDRDLCKTSIYRQISI